jgi:hypothetical protein
MLDMNTVVDLLEWRQARSAASGPVHEEVDVVRLEGAIRRLDIVASRTLESGGTLAPWVETELLAIMGALSMDLFDSASERAERLADRLDHPSRSARR